MKLTIGRPTRADIEQIHALFEETIRDTFDKEGIDKSLSGDMDDEIASLKDKLARDFTSDGADEYFLVARVDGHVVGTVALGPAGNFMRSHVTVDFDVTPEMKAMYIRPAYQRRGIGTALFKAIIEEYQRRGVEEFVCDSGYRSAQRYWIERLGDPVVTLPDYWEPGAPHMFWRCRVADFID